LEYYKEILGLLAAVIGFASLIPYIINVLRGKIKPHMFSWIIWGTATLIVFFAQWAEGGGPGAWQTGIGGCMSLFIAGLAYFKNPELVITKSDWLSFIAALAAIPLWYLTNNPLWSVILLTMIDVTGYFPTLRKAYTLPDEESGGLFLLQTLKNWLGIAAMQHYSVVTILFPATLSLINFLVPLCIYMGRRKKNSVAEELEKS